MRDLYRRKNRPRPTELAINHTVNFRLIPPQNNLFSWLPGLAVYEPVAVKSLLIVNEIPDFLEPGDLPSP